MRIGFDVAQTCVDKAGCGWYADSLVREMVRIAPEHRYILYHHFDDWVNADTAKGTVIPSAPNVETPFHGMPAGRYGEILAEIRGGKPLPGAPEIVHSTSYRAPKLAGTRLVFTVFDTSFWMVPEFATEENRLVCQNGVLDALRNADAFVFISQSARDEFEHVLPGWLERARRPFAVTLLGSKIFPRPAGPAPGPPGSPASPYWLALGSLEPRKNFGTLLDAMVIYWGRSSRRIPLRIAGGSGWKSDSLRERIARLSEQGIATHLGYVADAELPGLYAGAQAFIFPSWYEGFGLPVLEAMSCGCPVVSSDRTSLKEVGGDAAIFIDPASPGQIADAMLKLESDPSLRQERALQCARHAAGFSWKSTASATLDLYSKLLASA